MVTANDGLDAPFPRRRMIALFSLLALAIGLPFLAFFVIRHIVTVQNIAALSAVTGRPWTARDYLVAAAISPIIVPALWCAAASYGALLDGPRVARRVAGAILLFAVIWAGLLAIRIATL